MFNFQISSKNFLKLDNAHKGTANGPLKNMEIPTSNMSPQIIAVCQNALDVEVSPVYILNSPSQGMNESHKAMSPILLTVLQPGEQAGTVTQSSA